MFLAISITLLVIIFIARVLDEYYKKNGYYGLIHFLRQKKVAKKREAAMDLIDKKIENIWNGAYDLGDIDKSLLNLIVALQEYESEVNNGGFQQYFFNSSGDNWKLIKKGLKISGNFEQLSLFLESINLFEKEMPSTNRMKRQKQLEYIDSSKFNELDKKFYQLEGLHKTYRVLLGEGQKLDRP